jgi:hypothetical protein
METLSISYKQDKEEIVEANGYNSVDKDTNERMPLLPHVPTKVEKDNGETSVYSHFVCHDELRYILIAIPL